MARDNSTGKTKEFYDKGQAIFDRIPGGEIREFQQPSDVVRDVEELQGLLRDVCDDFVGYLNTLSAESVYQQVLLGKLHRIDTYLKEKGWANLTKESKNESVS